MGILLGLGILWAITEIIHVKRDEKDKHKFSVVYALRKIDSASILFFLGILVSIAALQSTGILSNNAEFMTASIGNDNLIVISIGLLSAIVDNVPLVAAAQGMYGFTFNNFTNYLFFYFLMLPFWQLLLLLFS